MSITNETLKIAIVGYGAMGKSIEKVAQKNNIEVTDIFDINSPIEHYKNYNFDVAIDFSSPAAIMDNIKILTNLNKNIVIGTTGWYQKIDEVRNYCEKAGNGIIWASNFSVGMQIFFKIIKEASKAIDKLDSYDIFINEIHHNNKIDSPSGTANMIANIILENNSRKKTIITETLNRKISSEELHISSNRGGNVVGTHTVFLDSTEDMLELKHIAKNRNGFAEGAVLAAKWIFNKKGFYNFSDLF